MAQQVFTNRYEIVRHLARGGMAEVYLARDLLLDRHVALKVLFPELSADRSFVERFRREAQAAANLNHPNIVSVYDWGEEGSTYFIVMEYVDGPTLREVVRAEGRLHPDRAAEIAADIADALGFAHRNGVIHRDVKPGNVLITSSGQVKVTDFGIARAARDSAQENLTQTGTVMGTATYFSPEQAQGLAIDPRSDVYALGVVLYEMLTGRPPFAGDNPVAIAYQHVREEPMPPGRLNPDVPAPLEAIVLRALAKSRDHRYPSAADLRTDLLHFRQGLTVAAQRLEAPPPAPATIAAPAYRDGTRAEPAVTTVATAGPPPPPERRNGAYIVLLFVLLGVLGVLLFLLYREFAGDSGGGTVAVPNVLTRPVEEATRALRDAGLDPVVDEQANTTVAPGVVFAQDPPEGTSVDRGSEVRLTVSAGAPPVEVPSVVGQHVDDARDLLEGLGLSVEVVPQASDDAPAGEVLAQEPAPGTELGRGEAVSLAVSSGKERLSVPDVVGMDATEAANELGQAGFRVAKQVVSSTAPKDEVVRTSPSAGTQVEKGSTVTMFVSSGKVAVPTVVGQTEAEATATLEDAGFDVASEETPRCTPSRAGLVVEQSPRAGAEVDAGSTVTITVCRPAVSPTTTTAPSATTSVPAVGD